MARTKKTETTEQKTEVKRIANGGNFINNDITTYYEVYNNNTVKFTVEHNGVKYGCVAELKEI